MRKREISINDSQVKHREEIAFCLIKISFHCGGHYLPVYDFVTRPYSEENYHLRLVLLKKIKEAFNCLLKKECKSIKIEESNFT